MKDFKVEDRICKNCAAHMKTMFFVYVSETERHDRWLESADLVSRYCDVCFRETPSVMLFVEFFCPECGDYKGIYMECTPYTNAHFLTELSATRRA